MTIYYIEEQVIHVKYDYTKESYAWKIRVRTTNEQISFEKLAELETIEKDKQFRLVKLLA